jgi:hypothetical protein
MHCLPFFVLKVNIWVTIVIICLVMLLYVHRTIDQVLHVFGKIVSQRIVPSDDMATHIAQDRMSAVNITIT